jgi:ABC-type antimicrobial peptide transport system permease subunit
MHIPIVAGEPFSPTDTTTVILINEEAARIMNFENPIGQIFYMNKGEQRYYTIKGVVKDFHFKSLNEKINPLVITYKSWRAYTHIYVKTTPEGAKSALATAEKIWKEYEPDYNFQYMFLEENFEHNYKAFIYIEQLLSLFAIIAIFISCLGLFGLVTYTAETKTKEIAIRKTLGASVGNIVAMLSKEFLILVGIAMLMAFPAAYYFMNKMLQDYAYRITVDWRVFALSGLITVLLTLLAVGWQVYRAAVANPANAIKTE